MPFSIPRKIGVMLLPETCLFPDTMLPLYIFEPRYQNMLAAALDGDRIFGIASRKTAGTIGGAGIVRACVGNPDGTSHLILQGLARVRFTHWVDADYPLACVETVESMLDCPATADGLRSAIMQKIEALAEWNHSIPEHFLDGLKACECHSLFSDLIAASLVSDPSACQTLLATPDVVQRLELLDRLLANK